MTEDENKAAASRFAQEVVSNGNFGVFDDLVSPTYVEHTPPPGVDPGREGLRHSLQMLRAAFPDLRSQEQDVLADGDKVVYRGVLRGTQQGEFMGIPATGKSFQIDEVHILRMEGGQLAEHWGVFDNLTMLQQLGAIPQPNQ